MAKDVEQSYLKIARFTFVNVDDDMKYNVWFDNNKALWAIEIARSPDAEMTIEERADFFQSELFRKTAKKAYFRILDAKKTYDANVQPHLNDGELLLVDVVKLEAILDFIGTGYFMKNMIDGKYLSY